MRLYTLKIAAGEVFELAGVGDYVRVRSSAVDLIIEQPDSNEQIEVSQGDDFQLEPFRRLRISHANGAEQTVKLIISKGKKAGSAQVGGSVNIGNNQGAFTQGRVSLTNVAQTLLAANAARRAATIQNNDAAQVLRYTLDGSNPTATAGFRLQPGESYDVPAYACTGTIKAIMEAATAAVNNVEFSEG